MGLWTVNGAWLLVLFIESNVGEGLSPGSCDVGCHDVQATFSPFGKIDG